MSTRTLVWDMRVDATTVLWRGRRLRVEVTLVNVGAVAAIPDPRRLRPTLRDAHNQGLAIADIMRLSGSTLSVFRPVVPPGGSVQACLQFERLPPDRAPVSITIGEPDAWTLAVLLPDPTVDQAAVRVRSSDEELAASGLPPMGALDQSASSNFCPLDGDLSP